MAQKVYVDLDLSGNSIIGLANGTSANEAVNKSQLDAVNTTVGNLSSSTNTRLNALELIDHAPAVAGTGIAAIDGTQTVAVNQTWLNSQISTGLTGYVKADGTVAFTGKVGGVNAVATSDLATLGQVQSGDSALTTRINGLTLAGSGMVQVTENPADTWTINVDPIALANTYVGTGTGSVSINADLGGRNPAIVPNTGDLYINSSTGQAFIESGMSPPGDWVALAAAGSGVTTVNGTTDEVTVTNSAGPVVTIGLASAIKTAISTATSTNGTQASAITALQGQAHAAASGSNAIAVNGGTQAVSLTIDPAGFVGLTQSASGLKLDLGSMATNSHVPAVAGNGVAIVAETQTVSAKIDAVQTDNILTVSANGLYVPPPIHKAVITPNVSVAGPYSISHNLGTANVQVTVWVNGCVAAAGICYYDINTLILDGTFGAEDAVKVVVVG